MNNHKPIKIKIKAGLAHYSIREVFLVVRDTTSVPYEIAPYAGKTIHSSAAVFELFRNMNECEKESFWCLHLDGKNRIKAATKISEGTMTSSLVHPREVYRPAIAEGAASLVFVHNHPSGDPAPSLEDVQITRRLAETGKIVGIKPLDHVIIGNGRHYSFAESGLL